MTMLPASDAVCSEKQLGEVLGLSSRQVDRLAVTGILKRVRCSARGKHFKLNEATQAYLAYQKEYVTGQIKGADDDYLAARSARMRALAQTEQLRVRLQRDELLERSRVVLVVTALLSTIKCHMLAIATRVSHQLVGITDPREIAQKLGDEIRLALREASQFRVRDIFSKRRQYRTAEVEASNGADEQSVDE